MTQIKHTWTRAHDLALIFIALAYGTDQDLSEDELATITDVLQDWREDFPADEAQDVVMEAVAIYLRDDAEGEVVRSVDVLKQQLSVEERQRALEDVVRIAKADGVVLSTELDLIRKLAERWELRTLGQRLIESAAADVISQTPWTTLHDIGLMYLVLAHSSDNRLSDVEIAAMVERLGDWQPDLSKDNVRQVLREALAFYSKGPDQEALQKSVRLLRKKLPVVHRLVLLDDLVYIAQADGAMSKLEKEMLANFSQAWGVSIRVNGEAPSREL